MCEIQGTLDRTIAAFSYRNNVNGPIRLNYLIAAFYYGVNVNAPLYRRQKTHVIGERIYNKN